MNAPSLHFRNSWAAWWLVGGLVACGLSGCDDPVSQFPANDVYALRLARETGSDMEAAQTDVQAALQTLFGRPDDVNVPAALEGLVDLQQVQRAAGPVFSDQQDVHRGLYREHCGVCHGVAGSGRGPAAAMQKPYPRDYRMGIFKFKSTPRGEKPTRDDLRTLLQRGIPGTAMPSFILLSKDDREALIDHLVFLSIRGEVERRLLAMAAREFDYGAEYLPASERLFAAELQEEDPAAFAEQLAWIEAELEAVAARWKRAEARVQPVPAVPAEVAVLAGQGSAERDDQAGATLAAIRRGQALFHGPIANCVGCHGPAGAGGAVVLDYDDWTKDWTTRIGLTPSDAEAIAPFREAGAFKPRQIKPRNLQLGVFHGGGDPATLYRRIVCGIDGTPMPAAPLLEEPAATGLTARDVWDLVAYVLALADGTIDPKAMTPPPQAT